MGDHGLLPVILLAFLLGPIVLAVAGVVLLVAAVRWSNRTRTSPPTEYTAGWYPDPWMGASLRYWDGQRWTAFTRPPPMR